VLHEPAGPVARLAVHVHAFAEEMNKSRHMVAAQARALASERAVVLLPDLLGCGDSDGELREATWDGWVDDVAAACAWVECEFGPRGRSDGPLERWLWGHRAGALLAVEAAQRLPQQWNLLLWQPVLRGEQALQQFLRLDAAASMMAADKPAGKGSAKALLASGQTAEVAGYEIPPALASGLARSRLQPPAEPMRLEWLEVSAQEGTGSSPAVLNALQAWRDAGWAARHHVVSGPAFWQTTEVEDVPQLVDATCLAVTGRAARDGRQGAALLEVGA
jgi:exosortase A-associated hydrolase 2